MHLIHRCEDLYQKAVKYTLKVQIMISECYAIKSQVRTEAKEGAYCRQYKDGMCGKLVQYSQSQLDNSSLKGISLPCGTFQKEFTFFFPEKVFLPMAECCHPDPAI